MNGDIAAVANEPAEIGTALAKLGSVVDDNDTDIDAVDSIEDSVNRSAKQINICRASG